MRADHKRAAAAAIGFMPEAEGLALYELGKQAGPSGPLLEIGSYCGKSAIYLGSAAEETDTVLFSVDHHRGSEENQPGWEYHDPRLVDESGRLDTLPWFRRAIAGAGLERSVVAVVGHSAAVAAHWSAPLGMVFIDGGHTDEAVQADYAWSRFVVPGGILAIHDVFADPKDGGQAPYRVYLRAMESGEYEEVLVEGSLRGLRKTA